MTAASSNARLQLARFLTGVAKCSSNDPQTLPFNRLSLDIIGARIDGVPSRP